MYKMKELCELTGLTERTVRYYMEENLLHPIVEDGVHRKAYFFTEEHIQTLKDIAALRSAGFSIAEVKEVLQNPAKLSAIIGKKELEYEDEIAKIKSAKEILGNLSIEEYKDISKLADAIQQRTPYQRETPSSASSRKKWRRVYAVLFPMIVVIVYISLGRYGVLRCAILFGAVVGIWSFFMGMGYLGYDFRYKKMKHHGTGKIVAIMDGDVNGNAVENYLGESKWASIRTFLSLGIVHWNWVRPDHWFPIIQFETSDGIIHTTTFRYGLLKKNWNIGDEVEIAWNETEEHNIYPYKSKKFIKKGTIYLVIGMVFLLLAQAFYVPSILYMRWLMFKANFFPQNYTYEQSAEPRELTTEEIDMLMQEIELLEPIVYREGDFHVPEITNQEIMQLLYPLSEKNLANTEWLFVSSSYFDDIAFALFGKRYGYEDLMCECGVTIATYNDKMEVHDLCEPHFCEITNRQYEVEYIYQNAYYDGMYYRVFVYQLFSDVAEEANSTQRKYYTSYNDLVKKENCVFTASNEQKLQEQWKIIDSSKMVVYEYTFQHHEKKLDLISAPEVEHYLVYYGRMYE